MTRVVLLTCLLLATPRALAAPAPAMPPAPPPSMAPGVPPGMASPTAPGTQPAPPPEPSTAELKPGWKPHAGASIDLEGRKKIYVGDVFKVKITVIAREEISVNLPTSLELGDFSLVGREQVHTEKLDEGKVKHAFVLRVAAFGVGDLELPEIPVTFVPPRAAFKGLDPSSAVAIPPQTVVTKPVRQRICSVLANEPHPQLRKNAPPVEILVEDKRLKLLLLIGVGVLAGIALGFLLYFLLRRRRARWVPPPPPRPAHEIALEKLTAVRQAGHLERGEFKPFYFGVSEAIREYLGNRYGFDSLELTTTELMDEMQPVTLVGVSADELQAFLLDCDLVKFAKYIPPMEDAQRTLSQAEHIVHTTKLIPVEPDEDDDDDDDPTEPPQPRPSAPKPVPPEASHG